MPGVALYALLRSESGTCSSSSAWPTCRPEPPAPPGRGLLVLHPTRAWAYWHQLLRCGSCQAPCPGRGHPVTIRTYSMEGWTDVTKEGQCG